MIASRSTAEPSIAAARSPSPPGDTGDRRRALSARGAVARGSLAALLAVAGLAAFLVPRPLDAQGGDPYLRQRLEMVESQIHRRGVEDPAVLRAMGTVPRHLFVPETRRAEVYEDIPVTIAPGQTLSQAYLSALMISLLDLDGDERVLEIGTGSGYDAAVLAELAAEVYTIEIDEDLARRARQTLAELGIDNVQVRNGDGYRGWPERAPFDAILMTTAPVHVPEPLWEQLAPGGRMVVAVGGFVQDLQVITKAADGTRRVKKIKPVRLGEMSGEVRRQR